MEVEYLPDTQPTQRVAFGSGLNVPAGHDRQEEKEGGTTVAEEALMHLSLGEGEGAEAYSSTNFGYQYARASAAAPGKKRIVTAATQIVAMATTCARVRCSP